jgi:plastocyanin
MLRRLAFAAALLLGLGASAEAAEVKAQIKLFQFAPKEVRVKAGDSVAWTNGDAIPHSVTADGEGKPAFDTGLFTEGEVRKIAVTTPGRYGFHCARHASMKGTLIVE